MTYDFDKPVDCSGSGDLKHEALLPRWGRNDLLPLKLSHDQLLSLFIDRAHLALNDGEIFFGSVLRQVLLQLKDALA